MRILFETHALFINKSINNLLFREIKRALSFLYRRF